MTEATVKTNQNQPLTVVIGCDTFPPDINGASRFAERLAGGLARHGNDVHVIAAAYDNNYGSFRLRDGTVIFPTVGAKRTILFNPAYNTNGPHS